MGLPAEPRSGAQPATARGGDGTASPGRIRVLVAGHVVRVTLQPAGGPARYEAELEIETSYRTVVTETATGSSTAPGGSSVRGPRRAQAPVRQQPPSRHQSPDQRMRHRAAFAPPTSVIALDMPRFEEDEEAPVRPGARVQLVWHGQRTVPGIRAGTRLRCSGLLAFREADPVIHNPRYEIVSRTS